MLGRVALCRRNCWCEHECKGGEYSMSAAWSGLVGGSESS